MHHITKGTTKIHLFTFVILTNLNIIIAIVAVFGFLCLDVSEDYTYLNLNA